MRVSDEDFLSSSVGRKLGKMVYVCDCNKGNPNRFLIQFETIVDKEGCCKYCGHYSLRKELLTTGAVAYRQSKDLTPEELTRIKEKLALGFTQAAIAKEFGKAQATIGRISRRLKEEGKNVSIKLSRKVQKATRSQGTIRVKGRPASNRSAA